MSTTLRALVFALSLLPGCASLFGPPNGYNAMAPITYAPDKFSPVIDLPKDYEVNDFTKGYDAHRKPHTPFNVGRYDEDRKGMYTTPLFGGERTIHMGIDIGAPVGTPVKSFSDAEVFLFTYNAADGDYGYTVITRQMLDGRPVWALYGHLAKRSLDGKRVGQTVKKGDVIAWVGDKHENGGWNPHLHFQLSLEEPKVCDMPGVVAPRDRGEALKRYPDPRLVLGPLY